jgi:uncharacterized protein
MAGNPNVAVVAALFDAFARRDAEAMFELMTDDVVFEPASTEQVVREPYRGPEGIRRYLGDLARTWAEFRVTIHEYRGAGDRVLALGRVYAHSNNPVFISDSEIAFVWQLRDGRIVRGRTYTDPREAEAALQALA